MNRPIWIAQRIGWTKYKLEPCLDRLGNVLKRLSRHKANRRELSLRGLSEIEKEVSQITQELGKFIKNICGKVEQFQEAMGRAGLTTSLDKQHPPDAPTKNILEAIALSLMHYRLDENRCIHSMLRSYIRQDCPERRKIDEVVAAWKPGKTKGFDQVASAFNLSAEEIGLISNFRKMYQGSQQVVLDVVAQAVSEGPLWWVKSDEDSDGGDTDSA